MVRPTAQTVTPLKARSGYSPLRGPQPLARLVRRAGRLGHTRLALTDTNNLYGATRFHRLTVEAGVEPIFGAEVRGVRRGAVALVADDRGYENLCRLLTRAHRPEGLDLADPDELGELSGHLVWIVEDDSLAASLRAAGVDPGRLYVGIDPGAQPDRQLRRLVRSARRDDVPLTALGQALFDTPEERDLARVLAAARCGATYDSVGGDQLPHPGARLRGPGELARRCAEMPEAVRNNRRIAERCGAFRLLPREPVFPRFDPPGGRDARGYLRHLCEEGVRRRYGRASGQVHMRLEKELDLIERRGFCEYFLVVWDIVRYARRRRVPVAGRGSGGSSLVAYVLGITNVCPLAFDLPFERFLHERREDFPDLDIDFCWRIRDDVIDYALRRWGDSCTAMVCTHNTFQERSAFRETAKAFGLSDDQISRLRPDDADHDPRLERIGRLSKRMVGLLHNLSVHPGGIVIAPRGIDRHVPIQPAPKGVRITQYDKDGVRDVGLVKLDLLGNRSLSTLRGACDLIARHRGEVLDVEALPPADAATIRTLQAADTVGCNQIESPAMRHLLRGLRPDSARALMKALALIRPGAASIGMKETFLRRQRGLEPVPPDRPAVARILGETHGVMLYEDDVMLVAAAMLGTGLPEADRFRKAVQKCRTDEKRLALSREFLSRCAANGIDRGYAKGLWVQMAKFNSYSFCRAHAASYAMLAYACAYLKTHYPTEFWVACLNNNQSMYHPRVYVEQAKRAGVRFLLPDINRSDVEFAVEADAGGRRAVRIGLNRLGGLGPASVEAILAARRERPFDGLTDCLARTRPGRDEARALVQCGALDFTGRTRPTLMMELNLFFAMRPHRPAGQGLLLAARPTVPDAPNDYSPTRKYAEERRGLGVSAREHIMALYRFALPEEADTLSAELPDRIGRRVRIAGVLEAQRTARTQTGQTMMFLTLDDEHGLFEATLFPNACAAVGVLDRYGPYVIAGRVEEQYGSVTVTAESVTLHRAKMA